MGAPYAEVIGDPIAQSKSPNIHKTWLAELGLEGDFRATRVRPHELGEYFIERRQDPDWHGCNVTIPHKQAVIAHLDQMDENAREIGAVNCIGIGAQGLVGRNTDIDGVAAALDGIALAGKNIVLIGAGGGARAAIRYLLDQQAASVSILVRDPEKAAHFREAGFPTQIEIRHLTECRAAVRDAAVIINASPMGMQGSPEMPSSLLACISEYAEGRTVFDMVYKPLETPALAAARANGGRPIDGLTMLIGQARAAFEQFFGRSAPAGDQRLRDLLVA